MPRALILAAGGATRFGGIKQLAEVDGKPLLGHVLEMAAPWDPLVVLGAHADEIRARVQIGDHVVASDWADGQSASLRAGLAAIGADRVIVLLADQPWITREAVEAVLAAEGDAARATYAGRPGHPVVLGPALLARVGELSGDTGFRDLLAGATPVEVGHLCDPTDIDTPDDLP